MANYKSFLTNCTVCHSPTSKAYARANGGRCKACVTGIASAPRVRKDMLCPTCGERELTPYQKAHHYHCDACTRNADPMGYYNEVTGRND